ncbi:MAG: outer membrane protein assembly factor BamD, partial [Legionellales bacterium]|nr:outer membrane protein assembly factor BamD [Legionellales bacterium]
LDVAQFYLNRRAYVAAANRAGQLVRNYPSSESVQYALGIIIQANRLLHLAGPAEDALKVLRLNYPNSPVLRDLAKHGYIATNS